MIIFYSKKNAPVHLTEERWNHITRRHPEMQGQKEKIGETVSKPDFLQEGDFGEVLAVRFYPKTPLTKKHLIVAYREPEKQDGFILTAYFTNAPSTRRRILWKH